MYLIGDIGNTDIKICFFNKNLKLVKKIRLKTVLLNTDYLINNLKFINKYKSKIIKVLISSVVPVAYKNIKKFIEKSIKINCVELKKLKLNNLLKIKVNKKQIGSDRLANAISVIDNKRNFIIVDFGTATNFDVVIKNHNVIIEIQHSFIDDSNVICRTKDYSLHNMKLIWLISYNCFNVISLSYPFCFNKHWMTFSK